MSGIQYEPSHRAYLKLQSYAAMEMCITVGEKSTYAIHADNVGLMMLEDNIFVYISSETEWI